MDTLQVNSRGDDWLITTNTPCLGGSSCMVNPDTSYSYAIQAGGQRTCLNGEVSEFQPGFSLLHGVSPRLLVWQPDWGGELTDRQDPSRKVNLPKRPFASGQAVSNTGRVTFVTEEGLTVISFDERFLIPESVGATGAWISADGETIAFQVSSRWKVWRSGAVVTDRPLHGRLMKLTADGERALFLNVTADGTTQARLYRTTVDEAAIGVGADSRRLGAATISGDGRVLIGRTNHARLIRLDINTGEETTLLSGPPACFTGPVPRAGARHALFPPGRCQPLLRRSVMGAGAATPTGRNCHSVEKDRVLDSGEITQEPKGQK